MKGYNLQQTPRLMKGWDRWWEEHVFFHDGENVTHHALVIIGGGYFMDNELAVACTGRRLNDTYNGGTIADGVPTCIRCWAEILA